MKGEERSAHSVSAEWGDGTSWVLQMGERSLGEGRAADKPTGEDRLETKVGQKTRGSMEVRMGSSGKKMASDQYEYMRDLWHWGRRVRRDLLELELFVAKHCTCDTARFVPSVNDTEKVSDATLAGLKEELEEVLKKRVTGDPGDPPGGPFD
jgi:hypothetical protein